jgi:hypothetical protein
VITGLKRFQGQESGRGRHPDLRRGERQSRDLQRAHDWMARPLLVGLNFRHRPAREVILPLRLERAGRLTGSASSATTTGIARGPRNSSTSRTSSSATGRGRVLRGDTQISTCFALLFLAKGRAPVLINKLRHGPGNDWNLDTDDVRNLVGTVSRDWKHLLTWQVVDPASATVEDLLQAPILYFNGHEAPDSPPRPRRPPRLHRPGGLHHGRGLLLEPRVRQGASASSSAGSSPRTRPVAPLSGDHAVWRSRHQLIPEVHPSGGSSTAAGRS